MNRPKRRYKTTSYKASPPLNVSLILKELRKILFLLRLNGREQCPSLWIYRLWNIGMTRCHLKTQKSWLKPNYSLLQIAKIGTLCQLPSYSYQKEVGFNTAYTESFIKISTFSGRIVEIYKQGLNQKKD